jgi:L-alanine-DL-glutamate epimerase-like enolase superfamily enzyme
MQITTVHSTVVQVPLEIPIVSAVRRAESVALVLVAVETDAGITGLSYLQAFGVEQGLAVQALVAYLGGALTGEDPLLSLRCYGLMDRAINLLGRGGVATFALSGLDMALWDIKGKAYNAPVAALLGAAGTRVAAYQSAGLWLNEPEVVARQAAEFKAAGHTAMKMRVGRADPGADVEAVHRVREAVGPETLLMADANQAWSPQRAVAMGRALERADLFWLEEPVDHDDLDGHAVVARELGVQIATGENTYLPRGFRALVEARAADVLMPDVQRVGGITGWMRVAAIAEAWNLPLASHLFPEISVHVLAASPTAALLEYVPWAQPLMAEKMEIEDGFVAVPLRPGLGLHFDQEALERYAV